MTTPQQPLDVGSDQCRMGHTWRHVRRVEYERPEMSVGLDAWSAPVRTDQDVIMCTRCHLLSINPRRQQEVTTWP